MKKKRPRKRICFKITNSRGRASKEGKQIAPLSGKHKKGRKTTKTL